MVDTVEVVDHVRASIVCAVSVRSIRTVRVVGAVGLGMLWRSGLVVCGECWHVIGSGGYVLVGVLVVLYVILSRGPPWGDPLPYFSFMGCCSLLTMSCM